MVCYAMTGVGRASFAGECGDRSFGITADMYVHRTATSTILSIVCDIPTVSSAEDPTVTQINRFSEIVLEYASPGNYLVEYFPWMLYVPSPLAKWKREAREAYHYYTEIFEGMVQDVQHRIVRSHLASSSLLLTHQPFRTKAMNARVSLETCFENATVITLVTRNSLGYLLHCSTFGFLC